MHDERIVPKTIMCIDCLETAHLISHYDEEDPWQPGDVVVYRCSGCGDRWDVEVPEPPE